jgi:hypothetical protein
MILLDAFLIFKTTVGSHCLLICGGGRVNLDEILWICRQVQIISSRLGEGFVVKENIIYTIKKNRIDVCRA